jgi:hypothetical protein
MNWDVHCNSWGALLGLYAHICLCLVSMRVYTYGLCLVCMSDICQYVPVYACFVALYAAAGHCNPMCACMCVIHKPIYTMYYYTYVFISVCTYARMYVRTWDYMPMYLCNCVSTYASMQWYACTYTFYLLNTMFLYVCKYMHTYIFNKAWSNS